MNKREEKARKIAKFLYAIIEESDNNEAEWDFIVKRIKEKFTIKNWLTEVRGSLQYLINKNLIERVGSLSEEIYKRVY